MSNTQPQRFYSHLLPLTLWDTIVATVAQQQDLLGTTQHLSKLVKLLDVVVVHTVLRTLPNEQLRLQFVAAIEHDITHAELIEELTIPKSTQLLVSEQLERVLSSVLA